MIPAWMVLVAFAIGVLVGFANGHAWGRCDQHRRDQQ